ncbi:MAG: alpha/beta fold hydrolase [Lentimonas sp.]
MPAIDKPLEELRNYTGSSPRPVDFDDYWSAALKEMHALEPELEWRDAEFNCSYAKCQSLYFTGVGGARVHAKVVTPAKPSQSPAPALIFFHGYTVASPDWVEMLAYVAEGYTVVGLDCRGQGGQSEDIVPTKGNTLHGHIIKGIDDDDDKLYYRNVFLDTAQIAKIVMSFEQVDADRVSVAGLSQGGALALACASLEPRIHKTYSQYPFLCDYKRVWDMGLDQNAYTGLRDYFRRFDPLHKREDEIFNKLGYIDIVNLAPRIQSEVLMSLTLLDEVCPPSTQFAAYNAIRSKKSHLLYPDFGHENLPGSWDEVYQFITF